MPRQPLVGPVAPRLPPLSMPQGKAVLVSDSIVSIDSSEDEGPYVIRREGPAPMKKARRLHKSVLKDKPSIPDFVRGMVKAFPIQKKEHLVSALKKLSELSACPVDKGKAFTMTTACGGTELAIYIYIYIYLGVAAQSWG